VKDVAKKVGKILPTLKGAKSAMRPLKLSVWVLATFNSDQLLLEVQTAFHRNREGVMVARGKETERRHSSRDS
jgi:hypothetical protein